MPEIEIYQHGIDMFEILMNIRMEISANNQTQCSKCGCSGTNLNTEFCLACLCERERERGESDIISSRDNTKLLIY